MPLGGARPQRSGSHLPQKLGSRGPVSPVIYILGPWKKTFIVKLTRGYLIFKNTLHIFQREEEFLAMKVFFFFK